MPLIRRSGAGRLAGRLPSSDRSPIAITATRRTASGDSEAGRRFLADPPPDGTRDGVEAGEPAEYPNSANGVILMTINDQPSQCSGSIIISPSASMVFTAGHCLYDPETDEWASDLVFIPGYRDGATPFGAWAIADVWTTTGWSEVGEPGVDIAALQIAPDPSGTPVADVAEALGIGFYMDREQDYTEWGYPAEAPYDGERLYKTSSPWQKDDDTTFPPAVGITSDFTGGASGGPFTDDPPPDEDPMVLSVTSYANEGAEDLGLIFGPHFEDDAFLLYCAAGGIDVSPVIYDRRRGTGRVYVIAPCEGVVELRGRGLRPQAKYPTFESSFASLPVTAKGRLKKRLRRRGRAATRATITYFTPDGTPISKRLSVRLSRRR